MSEPLKQNEVLSFDRGLMTVKILGHGGANGWATLAFDEQQFKLNAYGQPVVELPPSELRALRDFLNCVLGKYVSVELLNSERRVNDDLRMENDRLRAPAQSVGVREALIEQCAKIAEPWSGALTGDKMGAMDRAIVDVRQEIADAIRALASQPSPAAPVETTYDVAFHENQIDQMETRKAIQRGCDAVNKELEERRKSHECSSAGNESAAPEGQLAGRDCPGVLESDPALFDILNNALGTMHYHRLMSALNWNGYVITREPQRSAGSVYDLLQRLRDYLDINRRPGNDLSPKFSAEITAALATFDEPQTVQVPAEHIARVIALSYGRDPDEMTEWMEMCDADNRPVPIWRVYEEQAEALLAAYSVTRPK